MDEKDMFTSRYWRINKFMLKTVGLWPYHNKNVKICIRTFILVVIHSMMIPQMLRTFVEWGKNSEIVIENITGFFYFQTVIAKYVTSFYSEAKLRYLYEQIMKDWKIFTDKEELDILRHFANNGRFLTIGYSVYLYIAGLSFATMPAIIPAVLDLIIPLNESRQKVICYFGEYFIDQQVYYYQLLLHTFVCVMCTIMLFTTIDSTYVCCVQHVIGLFNIVDYRLKKAFQMVQDGQQFKLQDAETEIHNCVLNSIDVHNKSIEFVDLLQSTYTLCFFLTIGDALVCISLGIVDVMMSLNNYFNFVRIFLAWCGIVLYLFYVSIPGQKIIDASSSIFNSVYFCGWYCFPLKTQRLLKFMMMRSSVPCQFTAGPLLVLNLENCGVILKTAMSYCTFIVAIS